MKRYEIMLELFFECLLTALQLVALIYFLPKALGFLWPFVAGYLIAVITLPISLFLHKRFHVNKKFVSALILAGLLAVVAGILYFIFVRLGREAIGFMEEMPLLYDKLEQAVGNLAGLLKSGGTVLSAWQLDLDTILGSLGDSIHGLVNQIGTEGVSRAASIAKNVTNFFIGAAVSLLSSYFFVIYRETLAKSYREFLPLSLQNSIDRIMEQVKGAVGGYLVAQLKLMGIVFLILLAGFLIMGNPYALLLAFLLALVDLLPFLGTGFILIPWAAYHFIVGSWNQGVWLGILYLVCLLARQILQPKIIGDSVGLHPFATLVLIYVGFKADGIRGFLLAMILGILIRNFYRIGLFDHKIGRFKRLLSALREAGEELEGKE